MLEQNVKDLLTQMHSMEPVVKIIKETSQYDKANDYFAKEVTLVDKLKQMMKLNPNDLLHHKDSFIQFRRKSKHKMKESGFMGNSGMMGNSALRSSGSKEKSK